MAMNETTADDLQSPRVLKFLNNKIRKSEAIKRLTIKFLSYRSKGLASVAI